MDAIQLSVGPEIFFWQWQQPLLLACLLGLIASLLKQILLYWLSGTKVVDLFISKFDRHEQQVHSVPASMAHHGLSRVTSWFKKKFKGKPRAGSSDGSSTRSTPREVPCQRKPKPEARGSSESTTATLRPAPSTVLQPTPTREQMWAQAYIDLEKSEPKLAEAFKKIVRAQLNQSGLIELGENDHPTPDQMQKLVHEGLDRLSTESAIKQVIGTALDAIKPVRDIMDQVVTFAPQASVPWAGVCLGLEIIANPITEAQSNHDGIAYVLSRIDWYWSLTSRLFDENNSNPSFAELRGQLVGRIKGFYQGLLSYQLKSICLYHRSWVKTILRDTVKLDGWATRLEAIKKVEQDVREHIKQYNNEELKAQLQRLDEKAGAIEKGLHEVVSAIQDQTRHQDKRDDDKRDHECLKDLRVTNPHDDKGRIKAKRGGLLDDCCLWILKNDEFMRFQNDRQSRLLWINGSPGKGKTMLLCSIIDELERDCWNCISYHFCEASSDILSSAVSVLRSLIWYLVKKDSDLVKYVREKYDDAGKTLFNDDNAWTALSEIATAMFQDPAVEGATIIIDALDECTSNRDSLLEFIVNSPKVRWIVSSRTQYTDIERRFKQARHMVRLTLEDNPDAVDGAVRAYIKHKVDQLDVLKEFNIKTRDDVSRYLNDNAEGTFLWVALVCSELGKEEVTREVHVMEKLRSFPPNLDELYKRMLQKIPSSMDATICYGILSLTLTVYRPVTLDELRGFVQFIDDRHQFQTHEDNAELEKIIDSSGSFLDVSSRDGTVSFVHKSARDFLLNNQSEHILSSGIAHQHYKTFSWSLELLHTTLKRDICDLQDPGYILDNSPTPTSDRLTSIRYSVLFWADHLEASGCMGESGQVHDKSVSVDLLLRFLNENYLQWLEALSLMRKIPEGNKAIKKLETISTTSNSQPFRDLVRDARRFFLSQKQNIESAPLQVYTSALIFSPKNSLIRKLYSHEYSSCIESEPKVPEDWDACLLTIEEAREVWAFITFSNNGSISYSIGGGEIRILDTDGNRLQTLKSHGTPAFSNDGRIAFETSENNIEIWDVSLGNLLQTLEGHEGQVRSLAFSPNGLIASGSEDGTVKIWDTPSGSCLHTLTDHDGVVNLVTFLTGGQQIMTVSAMRSQLGENPWDRAAQVFTRTIRGNFLRKVELMQVVNHVAVSADGQRIASSCDDSATVTIWDALGNCLYTLTPDGSANSLAYSTDNRLATGSSSGNVQVWDISGNCLQKFDCQYSVMSVAFSADGQRIAGVVESTIKVWDTTLGNAVQTVEHHEGLSSLAISADGQQFATGSCGGTVKLWDVSGNCIRTFDCTTSDDKTERVDAVAFSSDGRRIVASGGSLQIWDITSGNRTHTQSVIGLATSIAFSADGQQVVAGIVSKPPGLQIWDATSGDYTHIFEFPNSGNAVAFSIDSRHVASASGRTIKIWEVASGNCIQTFAADHTISSLAFSDDGQRVIVGCRDDFTTGNTEIWDTSGKRLQTIEDYHGPPSLIANLSDDERAAFSSGNEQLRLWGISDGDHSWITLNGKPLLWLPPEYRPFHTRYAIYESTVAITTLGGAVYIMRLAGCGSNVPVS